MRIYTSIKQLLFSMVLLSGFVAKKFQKLSSSLSIWWTRSVVRAYLTNQEPLIKELVSANPNRYIDKKTVVSDFEPEEEKPKAVFVKFTLVPEGVKMESSIGNGTNEDLASLARLLFQLTEGKQTPNLIKHLAIAITDQSNYNHVIDVWQTLKLLDAKQKLASQENNQPVVRASQVLQHSKGF